MCFSKYKIKNGEKCPCGSNMRFIDCCKGKEAQTKPSRKPPEVQIAEKMRASMKKCCMHPDQAHCKGNIKSAHALQNNKIISLLAGSERHVYMLDPKNKPSLIHLKNGENLPVVKISRIGANLATTETCFCDVHDSIAFATIENNAPDFDKDDEKMKFIYAYKAFIFELYKHSVAFQVLQKIFKDMPQVLRHRDMVTQYRVHQLKMKEFEPVKDHFDKQILANSFSGIHTCVVRIPFQIKFADYAYIAPQYDMDGNRIRHTVKGFMHRVAITIFPEEKQSWLLMSCLESEKQIYKKLFHQLETASLDKLKLYINLVLPLYSENMVLSPSLWSAWSNDVKMMYTHYANLHDQHAFEMMRGVGYMLKNAARSKAKNAYDSSPVTNLFI